MQINQSTEGLCGPCASGNGRFCPGPPRAQLPSPIPAHGRAAGRSRRHNAPCGALGRAMTWKAVS
jgi:hypothetical protein